MKRGFTLIELLVTIAIMGILTALLIPGIDRSLQKNRLAEDVDLFKSKMEETRLLSGSTQQIDDPNNANNGTSGDPVGYYGVLLRPQSAFSSFYIVRLSKDLNTGTCSVNNAVAQAANAGLPATCIVDRVAMSGNDTIGTGDANNTSPRVVAYKVPQQQLVLLTYSGGTWQEGNPDFTTMSPFAYIYYKVNEKTARMYLGNYSGKVSVDYI